MGGRVGRIASIFLRSGDSTASTLVGDAGGGVVVVGRDCFYSVLYMYILYIYRY